MSSRRQQRRPILPLSAPPSPPQPTTLVLVPPSPPPPSPPPPQPTTTLDLVGWFQEFYTSTLEKMFNPAFDKYSVFDGIMKFCLATATQEVLRSGVRKEDNLILSKIPDHLHKPLLVCLCLQPVILWHILKHCPGLKLTDAEAGPVQIPSEPLLVVGTVAAFNDDGIQDDAEVEGFNEDGTLDDDVVDAEDDDVVDAEDDDVAEAEDETHDYLSAVNSPLLLENADAHVGCVRWDFWDREDILEREDVDVP